MQTKATGPRNEPNKPQARVDTLWEPREASCVPSPKPSPPSAGRRILLAFLPETLNRVDGFLLRDNGPQSQDASSTPWPDQAVLGPTPPPAPSPETEGASPGPPAPTADPLPGRRFSLGLTAALPPTESRHPTADSVSRVVPGPSPSRPTAELYERPHLQPLTARGTCSQRQPHPGPKAPSPLPTTLLTREVTSASCPLRLLAKGHPGHRQAQSGFLKHSPGRPGLPGELARGQAQGGQLWSEI